MKARSRRRLVTETLEVRLVMTASSIASLPSLPMDYTPDDVQATIVAGSPTGSPADSPANRVDPNTTTSPFAGVGSIEIRTRRGAYICTGTPIDSTHVVTAAHCLDINSDGQVTSRDGIRSVTFALNYGGNITNTITASAYAVHPDFTGFARPSVNDDIAVLTLSTSISAAVPKYSMYTGTLADSTELVLVGYGRSGTGVSGYTVDASYSVKRVGYNNPNAYYSQDDSGRPAANEVFRYDFDGATGNGLMGGPTLGNARETTVGGGDSGGPSFVLVGGSYQLAGVNTFTQNSSVASAPLFGSLGGGMVVKEYASWINGIVSSSIRTDRLDAVYAEISSSESEWDATQNTIVPLSNDVHTNETDLRSDGLVDRIATSRAATELDDSATSPSAQPSVLVAPELVNPVNTSGEATLNRAKARGHRGTQANSIHDIFLPAW
jgi:Trypsin